MLNDHPALLSDARRPGLERPQEADVLDHRRAACFRARGPRRALSEPDLAIRGRLRRARIRRRARYPGLGANSLQSLMGLFLQCQGQYGTFLYTDPTDSAAASSTPFATGDGATTAFTLSRFLGPFLEPVGWVTALTQVKVAGSVLGSGWSLSDAEHARLHRRAGGRRDDRRDLRLRLPVPVRRRRSGFRAIHAEPLEGRIR